MPNKKPLVVTQEWTWELPLQMQSVLILALRGHDGKPKETPSKTILRAYRGTVLNSARLGRSLYWGEACGDEDPFMTLEVLADNALWPHVVSEYTSNYDELTAHFFTHLMHGAEIISYKHPDVKFRNKWQVFYLGCVNAIHLRGETESELDKRLGDWGQKYWAAWDGNGAHFHDHVQAEAEGLRHPDRLLTGGRNDHLR